MIEYIGQSTILYRNHAIYIVISRARNVQAVALPWMYYKETIRTVFSSNLIDK
jgi:hypothetical protein